jgi:molybdopterin synthase catalytic subunit
MKTSILLTPEPILPLPELKDPSSGAVISFSGVVRDHEDKTPISSLFYEVYQPMAENMMHQILQELSLKYPCIAVEVAHRFGHIPVGETSLWVRVSASHRAEAFGLLTHFIDRLKKDVPIWKTRP